MRKEKKLAYSLIRMSEVFQRRDDESDSDHQERMLMSDGFDL
jgi:hypothetical protein